MDVKFFCDLLWRRAWLLYLLLFLISFLPRLAAIGRYITPDELIWIYRSVQFGEALRDGQWAATLTTGHPGVTTMWLGTLGIRTQLWLQPSAQAAYQWITQLPYYNPENMAAFSRLAHFLTAARLAVIIVNSLGIVAIYMLGERLFGRFPALIVAALLAFDPFVAGLSGLFHVDALMTTFVILSLLALAQWASQWATHWARGNGDNRIPLSLAAGAAALAILSKSPALLLLPFTALIFLWTIIRGKLPVHRVLGQGLLWLFAFLSVTFLLFPALWEGPSSVIQLISGSANRHIETALRPTFFLDEMAFDHGPLFYPIALIFRLGPLVFLGLILAIVQWLRRRQRPSPATLIFILWSLLFLAAITIAAKKFDRYALPAIPALTIIAALAWAKLSQQRPKILLPALFVAQTAYLLLALPYPLIGYNPLVGGIATARRVLTIGWGEAVGAAGQWLANQPGAAQKSAVTTLPPALAPFFPGQTLANEDAAQGDYRILTASNFQANPNALAEARSQGQLLHTIHFNGLDQAWIFAQDDPQRPPPLTNFPVPLTFDNRVQLLAATADVAQEAIQIRLRWQLQQAGRYALQFTLRDENGHAWSQLNTPLLNETDFYPEHWASEETPQVPYTLQPAPAIPPGQYQIELSLFEAATGAQLPLLTADNSFRGVIYTLSAVTIPPPATLAAVSELDVGTVVNQSWLDDALILWGHKPLPPNLLSGSRTVLDLYWQAVGSLPENVQLSLQLGDEQAIVPLSRYPSAAWRVGEPIHEKYELAIPPTMPAGQYTLTVQPFVGQDGDGETAVSLGQIEIMATDRLFQLPATIATPLDIQFGADIHLRGVDGPTVNEDTLHLTLYWQSDQQPLALYTAFVHVLDSDGTTIAQADQWPDGRPSDTWAAAEVIVDSYVIPLPDNAAPVQLAIGLYTAENGLRLPITDAAANSYPDDRYLLPLSQ
jgi:4-amino-4-deoxy-L-arabinose transferase-like glycosyltransferase